MPTHEKVLQQQTALKQANYIRTWRHQLKKDIKAGKVEIEPLLLDPPEELKKMRIGDLLVATPRYGPIKIKHMLKSCYISSMTLIGDLTDRQREDLVRRLKRR